MNILFHQGDLPSANVFEGCDAVAIDTETMGLEVHRDRLCLVQLSSGNGTCHLVQIGQNQQPPRHLMALLSDPTVMKIFHFARFDVAALYHHLGVLTGPVFCTKIASKLVRTFTDKHGLKDLCRDILHIDISKQEQTSDWGAVTLTEEQKKYAATDVLHLHALKQHFEKMLAREDRMDIAKAAFSFLPTRAKLDVLAGSEYDILRY